MIFRIIALAFIFVFSFAGKVSSKFKKDEKKKSQSTISSSANIEEGDSSLIVRPSRVINGVRDLRRSQGGFFFLVDSNMIHFLNAANSADNFVGQASGSVTHICAFSSSDTAYFTTQSHIYFVQRLGERFIISERSETGGNVSSLICHSGNEASWAVGNTIFRVSSHQKRTIVFQHTRRIHSLAMVATTLFFHSGTDESNSQLFFIDMENQSHTRFVVPLNIQNLMGYTNGYISYTVESTFALLTVGRLPLNAHISQFSNPLGPIVYGDNTVLSRNELPSLFFITGPVFQENTGRSHFNLNGLRQSPIILYDLAENEIIQSLVVVSEDTFYFSTQTGLYRGILQSHYRNNVLIEPIPIALDGNRALRLTWNRLRAFASLWFGHQYPPDILFGHIGFPLYLLFQHWALTQH